MSNINWRTINIDALDPESAYNFDLTTLTPAVQPVSTSDVHTLAGQIRQLSRGGDNEGALRGALENAPYGADEQGKVCSSPLMSKMFEMGCCLMLWNVELTRNFSVSTLIHRNRDPAKHPTIRNDAYPAANVPIRRRLRSLRHTDEVPLQRYGTRSTCNGECDWWKEHHAAGDRLQSSRWTEFRWWGRWRSGDECAAELA